VQPSSRRTGQLARRAAAGGRSSDRLSVARHFAVRVRRPQVVHSAAASRSQSVR
jgi:hypothetical protein